jgi:signal transduction histidine kinase
MVAGEDGRLRRMFGNLLSNAVKYSPEGGNVSVHLTSEGDDAVLTVSDSGIGIPDDELDRVFDRLFRASNAVDGQFPGTGLGLAITRAIVEAHGGGVVADHAVTGGARFSVRLPLAKPAEETARTD